MSHFLTFDGLSYLIKTIYENPFSPTKYIYFYTFYQIYSIILTVRASLFWVINDKNGSHFMENDLFVYYFAVKTMQSNRLLILCCVSLLIYGSLMLHYTFFYFYKFEKTGLDD